jgi:tRNA-dihydrouridine synthase 1
MGEESARITPNGESNGTIHPIAALKTPKINNDGRKKLHGRAFYESLGSPKVILAPMVDQSEFVCYSHDIIRYA